MKKNILAEAFFITVLEGIGGGFAQNYSHGDIFQTAVGAGIAGLIGVLYFNWSEITENLNIGLIITNLLMVGITLAVVVFAFSKIIEEKVKESNIQNSIQQVIRKDEKENTQRLVFSQFRNSITNGKSPVNNFRYAIYQSENDSEYQYIGNSNFWGFELGDSHCALKKDEYERMIRMISSSLQTFGSDRDANIYWSNFRTGYERGYDEQPRLSQISDCISYFWDKPNKELLFLNNNEYKIAKDSNLYFILSLDYTVKKHLNQNSGN